MRHNCNLMGACDYEFFFSQEQHFFLVKTSFFSKEQHFVRPDNCQKIITRSSPKPFSFESRAILKLD